MINLALIKLCSVSEIEPGNIKMFEYKNTKILLINLIEVENTFHPLSPDLRRLLRSHTEFSF